MKRSSTRLKQTKENTFPSKHITKFRILLPQVTVEAKMTNVLKWDWTSRWNINNVIVRKGAVEPLILHMVGDLFKSTFQNTNEDVTLSFSCFYLQKIACPKKKIQNWEAENQGICYATYSSEIPSNWLKSCPL